MLTLVVGWVMYVGEIVIVAEKSGRGGGREKKKGAWWEKDQRDSECWPVAQKLLRQPRPGQTEKDKNIQKAMILQSTKYVWSTEK